MFVIKVFFMTLTGVTLCSAIPDGYGAPQIGLHGGHGGGILHNAPAKYDFSYGVNDPYHGTNFGHSESRDGYNTKGQYYVHLPDGRLQKVSYFTDEWGYHPTVTYEGEAKFPVHPKVIHGSAGGYH